MTMTSKGAVWEAQKASRILRHAKITSLPFTAEVDSPVSLFFVPKTDTNVNDPVVAFVRCLLDAVSSACPFNVGCWTETAVMDIPLAGNEDVFSAYDIYWGGAAQTVNI